MLRRSASLAIWSLLLISGLAIGCSSLEVGGNVPASNAALQVGKAAPPLSIAEWVQGEEVSEFKEGQVYVVEFWATWCPPCKDSMPHIAKLQSKYGDKLTVIGVSDEDSFTVRNFLKSNHPSSDKPWGEVAAYTIALDESQQTNVDYMQAAGQSGIPTAFLIGKDGKIQWIGHPTEIDRPLAAAINQ